MLHGSGDTEELNVSEILESSLRAGINFKVQSDFYVNYLKVFIWGVNISLSVVIFMRELETIHHRCSWMRNLSFLHHAEGAGPFRFAIPHFAST